MSRKIHGKVVFNESWLGDQWFKTCLKWGNDFREAVCILCNNSVIDITRMGVSALVSHAAGAKHKERLRAYNPISSLCFMNKNVNKDTPKLQYHMLKFTGLWKCFGHTFHIVMFKFKWTFSEMFPDSKVTKLFPLSKTKCVYYVVFGIAPYFKEPLVKDIKSSPFYSLSFDEILNNKLQEEQMDISIWFWDDIAGKALARYFDSSFFKRPNADNILEELLKVMANLPTKSLSNLSQDGPNTNWSVHEKLWNIWSHEEVPQLFEVGSCGLHVIHGTFQSGLKLLGGKSKKFLKACRGYSIFLQPEEIHILP